METTKKINFKQPKMGPAFDARWTEAVKKCHRLLNKKFDHTVIREVCSLFDRGILKIYQTQPETKIEGNQLKITAASKVQFEGIDKILELETLVEKQQQKIRELELHIEGMTLNHAALSSNEASN